jgi:hypothetical protein
MNFLFESVYAIFTAIIASVHADEFNRNVKIGPWFHIEWGAVAMVPIVLYEIFEPGWLIGLAIAMERFLFFPTFLNVFRKKPFFYIAGPQPDGSWLDALETKILGKWYPAFFVIVALGFAVVQYLLLRQEGSG